MKTYKAYLRQQGEGCDYTIGCAQTIITIEANSMDEAKEMVLESIKETYSHHEQRLKSVELFEVNNTFSFDMKEIYKRIDDEEYNEKQKLIEQKEREDYERLKKKFGNG